MAFHTSLGDIPLTPTTLTLEPVEDAPLQQFIPTANYGSATELPLSTYLGRNSRGIFRFDLSVFAEVGFVSAAVFSLWYDSWLQNNPVGEFIEVLPVTSKDWTELGVTWNSRVEPSLPWITPGGDYTVFLSQDNTIPSVVGQRIRFDMTGYVNGLLSLGDFSCELLVKFRVEDQAARKTAVFRLREYLDPAFRPRLIIG